MNTLLVIVLVCAAVVISSLVLALITTKTEDTRRSCFDIARQMIREWNTYSDEKKIACALWMGRLGVKVPREMIPSV